MTGGKDRNNTAYDAFLAAINNGDDAAVAKLAARGHDVNASNLLSRTPLFAAIEKKDTAIIRILLENGAATDIRDAVRRTPFDAAIAAGYTMDELRKLHDTGIRPRIEKHMPTPLHIAAGENRADLFLPLTDMFPEIDINATDALGDTALHIAVMRHAATDMGVRRLLQMGASPFMTDREGRTPLCLAVYEEKTALAKRFLKHPLAVRTVDIPDRDRTTPVGHAVINNDLAMLTDLIRAGASVNTCDEDTESPVLIAAQEGRTDALRIMIRKGGADIAQLQQDQQREQKTPLMHNICAHSSEARYSDVLAVLAEGTVWIDELDEYGDTALQNACDAMDMDKVNALLSHGADPDIANESGIRAIDIAIVNSDDGDMDGYALVKKLLEHGASPGKSPHPDAFESPLHTVIRYNMPHLMHLLLAHGAPPDDRDEDGMTPLHLAARKGRKKMFFELVAANADINALDDAGMNALHYAAIGGSPGIIKGILKMSLFDINAIDGTGRTSMHHAFENDNISAVISLFDAGADINAKDACGMTPAQMLFDTGNDKILGAMRISDRTGVRHIVDAIDWSVTFGKESRSFMHRAVHRGDVRMLSHLICIGADPLQKDIYGLSAFHHALLKKRDALALQIAQYISRHDRAAIATHTDSRGWTMLHYAARNGSMNLVNVLLIAGADINRQNAAGDTALHVAARYGNELAVRLLQSKGADARRLNGQGKLAFDAAAAKGHKGTAALLDPKKPQDPTPPAP